MHHDPVIAVLMAALRGVVFVLFLYLVIGILRFSRGLIQSLVRGEEHYTAREFKRVWVKVRSFRLETMGQRIGAICMAVFSISVIFIAYNTPSYRHYGDSFWLAVTLLIISAVFTFGWFLVIVPILHWIKTGRWSDARSD